MIKLLSLGQKYLLNHQISLKSYGKSDYYCNQCDKRFKSVGSLKTHMISHMTLPALPAKTSGSSVSSSLNPDRNVTETAIVPESVAKGDTYF